MLAVTVTSSSTHRISLTMLPDVEYDVAKYDCVSTLDGDGADVTATSATAAKLGLLDVTSANTAPGTYVSELASVTPSLWLKVGTGFAATAEVVAGVEPETPASAPEA